MIIHQEMRNVTIYTSFIVLYMLPLFFYVCFTQKLAVILMCIDVKQPLMCKICAMVNEARMESQLTRNYYVYTFFFALYLDLY